MDYAIRTENWELAALCLVVGAVEAVRSLPPDAVEELLSELDVEAEEGRDGRAWQARRAGQARAPTGERHGRMRGRGRGS